MLGTPPLADPLVVEITNRAAWWLPWLPPLVGLLGSVLVAVVALYSVHKTNGTNERAIEASDKRELIRWQRDKLFSLADEILQTSEMTTERLRGCVSWDLAKPVAADRMLGEINNESATVPMLGRRISFVTDDVAGEVDALFKNGSTLFLLVADNWKEVRRELQRDERPTLARVDAAAEAVRASQRTFVLAVRKAAADLDSKPSPTPPAAQTD